MNNPVGMQERVREIFKDATGVDLYNFGIDICIIPQTSKLPYLFDKHKPAIKIYSKWKQDNDFWSSLHWYFSQKSHLLLSMLEDYSLLPRPALQPLFYHLFPTYQCKKCKNFEFAAADDVLLMAKRDKRKISWGKLISDKNDLHRTIKEELFPLVYAPGQYKPSEYVCNESFKKIHKINEVLSDLHHSDKIIYASKSGAVLELSPERVFIVDSTNGYVKMGDKNSDIYKQFLLFKQLAN